MKTTITLEAGPDAAMPFTVEERDGWYIDLPGLGCQDSGKQVGFVYANLGPARRYHRIQVKRLGMAPAGFPIEQTIKRTEQGKSTLSKVELLEFSQAPLSDDALFQVPQGYSPALGTGHRGYDMTRPRTLANRAQMYWAELKILATQWFR